ncbi:MULTISPECIES: hypothetical protein [unclassified Mesorhizobium]|uniref:hypothetical protein n=1 Tax=unclassified Mesorhizobium TaxID=325217 RepID=UPI000BAE965E|nr:MULTISPECIES: hypothetical protein [unclassified Mesorhizobium]PBB94951.1 hypothetical protein CK224_29050 [Mesorhizobium sp. WSM3862]RUW55068.1 hypothetical protein EOA32_03355 [Mesorhizobium sp. M1A.F.Ca.ET.072.01.1.1]TIV04695.1 MAG: hypothetical protein E5W04_02050 [Mesorhizobium sp.]
MAPLPKKFDAKAHQIRDLLHAGLRLEALQLLESVIASGSAGADTMELASFLRSAPRGRQPFGAKHRWAEIGAENDELRSAGMSYEARLAALSVKYRLGDESKVKAAIAKYEAAMDVARSLVNEMRER